MNLWYWVDNIGMNTIDLNWLKLVYINLNSIHDMFIVHYKKYKKHEFKIEIEYLSLKYQKFSASGCNDIWIRKFEFVAKAQFLYSLKLLKLWNLKCHHLYHLGSIKNKNKTFLFDYIYLSSFMCSCQVRIHWKRSSSGR